MKIISHRGGCRWAPPNSLAGCRRSAALGVDIELDVRRCRSRELFLCHETDVSHATTGRGRIKDMNYLELRQLTLRQSGGERLPLLSEALEIADGKVTVHIEIKTFTDQYPGIEEDLLRLLEQYPHRDKITIASFDHDLLTRLRKLAPDLSTGAMLRPILFVPMKACAVKLPGFDRTIPVPGRIITDSARYCQNLGADAVYTWRKAITRAAVLRAHAAGLSVHAWTPNSPREWQRLAALGVDGAITDDPEGCLSAISSTGSGPGMDLRPA